MSRNEANKDHNEQRPNGSNFGAMPWCAGGMDSLGSWRDMRGMMQGSPCADLLRRHRLAVYTALTVVVLGFLVLHAGWVLGIIAFFRTL